MSLFVCLFVTRSPYTLGQILFSFLDEVRLFITDVNASDHLKLLKGHKKVGTLLDFF